MTRFFVLCREQAKRSGDDKTSLMFTAADRPGALVSVLSVFDRAGINLTHIDKRPSGRTNWTYTFFIDAQGHRDDPAMVEAVREASGHCKDLAVLGSYPDPSGSCEQFWVTTAILLQPRRESPVPYWFPCAGHRLGG